MKLPVCIVVTILLVGCASDSGVELDSPGDPVEAAMDPYVRANAHFDVGAYAEAVKGYEAVLAHTPEHEGAWCNLGLSLHAIGRSIEAEEAYRRALEIAPDNGVVLSNLVILLVEAGRMEEGVEVLERVALLDAKNVEVHSQLSVLYMEMGRYEDAIRALNRVIALDPGNATDHYTLGLCHTLLDRWEEALSAWRIALGLDPRNTSVNKGIAVACWQLKDYGKAWEAVARCQALGIPLDKEFIVQLQEDSGQLGYGVPVSLPSAASESE